MIVSLEEAVYPFLPKGGPLKRFEAWRNATEKGFELDLRSQLYNDLPRQEITERMWEELDLSELPSPLNAFEASEREKIGPMSIQAPFGEREGSLSEWYNPATVAPQDAENFSNAIASILPNGQIEPLDLGTAVQALPKRKGLGLPYLGSDPADLEHYIERAREVLNGDAGEVYDAMLYWRGTPGGPKPEDVKQRNVTGMDKIDAILGGRFVYPLTDYLKQRRPFSAWINLEAVDENITFMLERSGRDKISMDYTSFGPGIVTDLVDRVMFAVGRAFSNDIGLGLVTWGILNCGIVTPKGVHRSRTSGWPTGTSFTSVGDTLTNYGISHCVAKDTGTQLVFEQYLGDDSVLDFRPEIPEDEFTDAVSRYGVTTNVEKRYRDPDAVHYLQNVYSLDYQIDGVSRGVRPASRMLNGALSYERRRSEWSGWLAASRTLMQLNNCRWHPKFSELRDFIYRGDERLEQYSPEEIFSHAGGKSEVERVLGYDAFSTTTQDFNGSEW